MKLADIAHVIRSKNAGPTTLTLDLLFKDQSGYERACRTQALTPGAIAPLYGVPSERVQVTAFPAGC